MVRHAAAALDAKSPSATLECAMAKRFATDACYAVTNDALQLLGGYGSGVQGWCCCRRRGLQPHSTPPCQPHASGCRHPLLPAPGPCRYLKEYPIERYMRDLRVHCILEGTNEVG